MDLYESEARKSASAEAYYAANAMLGSASEARILLECPRQPAKIRAIIRDLPKGKQPRSSNPLDWSLNDLIEIAPRAGWLPNIDDLDVVHVVSGWTHRLRAIRNFLHLGHLYSTGLMLTSAKKSSSMPGRHILLCVTRSRWLASAFGRIHGGPELSDDVSQTDIAMARRHDLKGGVSVVRAEREANDPEADAVPASKVVARLEESKPPASSARQRR